MMSLIRLFFFMTLSSSALFAQEGDKVVKEPPATVEEDKSDFEKVGSENGVETKELSETRDIMKLLRYFDYSLEGKRDPFEPWEPVAVDNKSNSKKRTNKTELQQWELRELELLGVVWGVNKPRAMLRDPAGKVHFISKNTKVGLNEGYVAIIREGEVVIVESFDSETGVTYQTQILKVKQ